MTPAAFGPYRVLHQIGSGVMGPVFRAFDRHGDRLIAIKALRLDIAPSEIARLAEALRPLADSNGSCPALVLPADVGLEGTAIYLAQPLASGASLDSTVRQSAPIALERASRVIRAVADALDAAAARGLRHGALHPRDVLVSRDGDVRVTGTGVAATLEALGLKAPIRRPYTAPERARGEVWDHRADVYSLGAIAHELLTGRKPAGVGETEQDGVFGVGVTPERRVALRRALRIALAESPSDRFHTAGEFAEVLEEVQAAAIQGRALSPEGRGQSPEGRVLSSEGRVLSSEVGEPSLEATVTAFTTSIEDPSTSIEAPNPSEVSRTSIEAPRTSTSHSRSRSRFWLVIAAGLAIGVAIGSAIGPIRRQSSALPVVAATVNSTPTDTEVALAREPEPVPPVVQRVSSVSGQLSVRSTPSGALVTLDGGLLGETPITVRDLALGPHVIQVARPGHVPRTERVTLTQSAPASSVAVTLQKGLDLQKRLDVRVPIVGAIDVDSHPRGARVTIDGRAIGTTPLRWPEAALGSHLVELALAGYEPAAVSVVVRRGPPARVAPTLRFRR